jgi:zinc/manganese transport system ATP-binding protein
MNPAPDLLFELKDLTLSYQGRPALHHLSASFHQGQMWAVLGPNGSGKSTLLRVLSGELTHWEGQLRAPKLTASKIGYLGQTALLNQDLPVTVWDVVSQGLVFELSFGLWKRPKSANTKIEAALIAMDLLDSRRQVWTHLSGGQRQRALIARLLVQDADVLLLDEPMNSLDEQSQHRLLNVLKLMNERGKTIICVMHNEQMARKYFSQSLFLGPTDCPVQPNLKIKSTIGIERGQS